MCGSLKFQSFREIYFVLDEFILHKHFEFMPIVDQCEWIVSNFGSHITSLSSA